jgi:hypothetical protein
MKTTKKTRNNPTASTTLDRALRTKANRQDALDVITIRERKNEQRVSAADVFKKASL